MAMNIGTGDGGREPDVMMDINTTPLIDVMLVLIIMLIITIPVQLHSVNLNMPVGTPPPPIKVVSSRPSRSASSLRYCMRGTAAFSLSCSHSCTPARAIWIGWITRWPR